MGVYEHHGIKFVWETDARNPERATLVVGGWRFGEFSPNGTGGYHCFRALDNGATYATRPTKGEAKRHLEQCFHDWLKEIGALKK